ncbi:MAG: ferredoxin--NADP reductase [Methylotenera sp.]|nr:ferredoxin--NADP reductase [Oligoflexia bacterium]
MPAREITCKIKEMFWQTPYVLSIRFEPSKKFNFEAGQFLSIYVPQKDDGPKSVRRAYSISSSPEDAKKTGYEICIKVVTGGQGSSYLANLKPGDTFKATAPYGDFVFRPREGRGICFVCTGTGIAPIKAIVDSAYFQENRPDRVRLLFGARNDGDIIFRGHFEAMGINTIRAFSQIENSLAFKGRITDYLRSQTTQLEWHATDFYLCGNGMMIQEVNQILQGRGVRVESIKQEAYFSANTIREIKKAA